MEEDTLTKRKEELIKFLKNPRILPYLILFIIIFLGIHIRAQPLENFKDATTGKYISMELDSEIYLRYAKHIEEYGKLYDKDPMRNYPLGSSFSSLGLFTSYFVAYLYKFIHIFIPSITIGYVDIIYPLIATAILTLFLFLLLNRIFNWKVGLLASLFLNLSPPFLFRSLSSDHDILIMMFSIMSLYIYIKALDQKKILNGVILGGLAGFTTFLGLWAGGAAYIILAVLGIYTLINFLLNKIKRIHYFGYLSWIISFSIFLESTWMYGGIKSLITMFMTFPAYFTLIVILIDILFFKINLKSNRIITLRNKLKEKFSERLVCIFISLVLIVLLIFLFFNQNLILGLPAQIKSNIIEASAGSRWATTVAENKRPYVLDFFNQFGIIYMISVLAGAILLFYKLVRSIKKYALKLTICFSLFLLSFFFARSSPNSLLNGSNSLSHLLFFGGIILFSAYLLYVYIKLFKEKNNYENLKNLNEHYIILLIWFFIMIIGALSAIRFAFEFTPITTVLSAFCFVGIFDYLRMLKENWIKLCGFILIGFILFSPFSFAQGIIITYYNQTNAQAKYSGPGYNYQWQLAGEWVRENTSKEAVFAHWWDYGYWVQGGFERATITDGGNFIGWWNYLMGRNVLTAQTSEEPLKYLYAHNASYLLMINDEIGKYGAFSLIGSNENYDRFSSIPLLGLDPKVQETRNETLLIYNGGFGLDEDLIYKNEIFPKGSAGIAAIILPIKEENSGGSNMNLNIGQPIAVIIHQNQRVDIPLKCMFFNGKKIFENGLDACLMLIPLVQGDKINQIGAAYYLSKKVKDSLFTRLYLFNEEPPYFKKVYSDENQVPIIVYNGRMVGPIKIWKINYPNLKLTSEEYNYYLGVDYPESHLNVI